ncbi:SDR family oxidoreductase [Streptomyces griseoruber]|uniref:SDR family oxidoreductase n=1 Tax=Streptomyces griseoruber TaxID=1943 RepID=UPI00099ED160|nr:SDR family oxidoreductase [Streptomyces griseoruber]
MFEQVHAEFGGVDVVVNCAGRLALSPIADLDLSVLDAVHRTNIRGTFVVAQQAARQLRVGGSFVAFRPPWSPPSSPPTVPTPPARARSRAITLILARELRGRDITVNAVAPGPTATGLFLDGKTDEQIEALTKAPPLERLGTPADIAHVVAFLTSREGHWVNGQILRANGGLA